MERKEQNTGEGVKQRAESLFHDDQSYLSKFMWKITR